MGITPLQRTSAEQRSLGNLGIRHVTAMDKEWILNVSEAVYSKTGFGWVRSDASESLDKVLASPNVLFLRGDKTYFYAFIEPRLCDYARRDACMELLVGEGDSGREVYRLLLAAVDWCRMQQVDRLVLSSITEHNFGKTLLEKLGAKPRIVYDIVFRE